MRQRQRLIVCQLDADRGFWLHGFPADFLQTFADFIASASRLAGKSQTCPQ
jgi:hypothetical protein